MKAITAILCGLGLAAGIASAAAQAPRYGTTAFFQGHCKAVLENDNATELFHQGECVGMLMALSYVSEQLPEKYRFCSPDISGVEFVRVLLAYIDKNRSNPDAPLIDVAAAAFRQEWPCQK